MKIFRFQVFPIIFLSFAIVLAPAAIRAEVTKVEISSRQDVLNGKPFGSIGAYEKLVGEVYFSADPNNAHNKIIADVHRMGTASRCSMW
jgi:hypothetical protein